ncbi:MAG: hypothetical protein ACFFBP_19330, partial [Promethearchaeota archaeon]
MELFFKRSENSYNSKIGVEKTNSIFERLMRAMLRIPQQYSDDLGSEIPKLIFKISQEIDNLSPEIVEGVLNHILFFTYALNDLGDQERKQVHQVIMTRSKNTMRSLLDLLNSFVNKAKNNVLMKNSEGFEDILIFLTGESTKVEKFDDVHIFFQKAEKSLAQIIGEVHIKEYIRTITDQCDKIARDFRDQMRSEIAKYLFKLSQNIKELSHEPLLNILNHVILFIKSISDLKGRNKDQTNQYIIKRSKNKLHGLFDLFLIFIDKAKEGNLLESSEQLEDILTFIYGSEETLIQFKDVGGFLKRAQSKYAEEIGIEKSETIINELLDSLQENPPQFAYLGSDISKYLFNYSNTITGINPFRIEKVLTNSLVFINSLKILEDFTNEQANQFIINRSNHEFRNLFDLYKEFMEKNKKKPMKIKNPQFDDILIYTLGKYIGPKAIEEADKIHEMLADYQNEFPLVKDHSKWVNSILTIVPRFLEVLQNEEGDQIIDLIWENNLPEEQINIAFREKINELPRDDEKKFLFKLLHFLIWQILVDEEQDRALTGAVCFTILAKIFVDIFNGRNAMIRAIKINELLKKRDNASVEVKKEIDFNIQKILEEDFKSIQRRFIPIKEIISVAYTKKFFVKIYDFIEEDYPELIKKSVSSENSLKYIGNKYLDSLSYGEMISELKSFLDDLEIIKNYHEKYVLESINIPQDAMVKSKIITNFLEKLMDFKDNITPNRFYENQILISEHSTYLLIIKMFHDQLSELVFKVRAIFEIETKGIKIISMARYLSKENYEENEHQIIGIEKEIDDLKSKGHSDDSESVAWLITSLELRENDKKKYILMEDILKEVEIVNKFLEPLINFSKKLISFLDGLKEVHQNLPAAFFHYINNLEGFQQEIDHFIEEIKKSEEKELISPKEFNKIQTSAR